MNGIGRSLGSITPGRSKPLVVALLLSESMMEKHDTMKEHETMNEETEPETVRTEDKETLNQSNLFEDCLDLSRFRQALTNGGSFSENTNKRTVEDIYAQAEQVSTPAACERTEGSVFSLSYAKSGSIRSAEDLYEGPTETTVWGAVDSMPSDGGCDDESSTLENDSASVSSKSNDINTSTLSEASEVQDKNRSNNGDDASMNAKSNSTNALFRSGAANDENLTPKEDIKSSTFSNSSATVKSFQPKVGEEKNLAPEQDLRASTCDNSSTTNTSYQNVSSEDDDEGEKNPTQSSFEFSKEVEDLMSGMNKTIEDLSSVFSPLPKVGALSEDDGKVAEMIDNLTNEIQAERRAFKSMLSGGQLPDILSPVGQFKQAIGEKQHVKHLEAELIRLRKEISSLQQQHAEELKRKATMNEDKVNDLNGHHKAEVDRLHEAFQENLEEARRLAVSSASDELEKLQDSMGDLKTTIQAHEETIQEKTNALDEKSLALTKWQQQYVAVEDELLETLDRLEDLREQVKDGASNKGDLRLLQEEVERLQYQLSQQASQQNVSEQTQIDLKKKCQSLEKNLLEKTDLLEKLCNERNEVRLSLEQEIVTLRTQIEHANQAHSILQESLTKQHAEQLAEVKRERDSASASASKFQDENDSLRAKIKIFEKEITKLQSELAEAHESLLLKDEISTLELNTMKENCLASHVDMCKDLRQQLETMQEAAKPSRRTFGTQTVKCVSSSPFSPVKIRPTCPVGAIECNKPNAIAMNFANTGTSNGRQEEDFRDKSAEGHLEEGAEIHHSNAKDNESPKQKCKEHFREGPSNKPAKSNDPVSTTEKPDEHTLDLSPTSAFKPFSRPTVSDKKSKLSTKKGPGKQSPGELKTQQKRNSDTVSTSTLKMGESEVGDDRSKKSSEDEAKDPHSTYRSRLKRKPAVPKFHTQNSRSAEGDENKANAGPRSKLPQPSRISRLAKPSHRIGQLKSKVKTTASSASSVAGQGSTRTYDTSRLSTKKKSQTELSEKRHVTSKKAPSVSKGQKIKSRLPQFGQKRSVIHKSSMLHDPKNSVGNGTTARKIGLNNKIPSGIPSAKKKDNKKSDETSPKELIKKVLKALSPAQKSAFQSPFATLPAETIEPTPSEVPPKDVEEKFESLFLNWSTTKKASASNSPAITQLPTSLNFDLSSAKKALSGKKRAYEESAPPQSDSKQFWAGLRANATPHYKAYANSPMSSSFLEGSLTPLIVRNVVVEVFSPEELLVSPPATQPNSVAKSSVKNQNAAKRIQSFMRMVAKRKSYEQTLNAAKVVQAILRGFLARKSCQRLSKEVQVANLMFDSAVTIQRHVKGWSARHLMVQKISAAVGIQSSWRKSLQRKTYLSMLMAVRKNQENLDALSLLESSSALVMQKWWRGEQARETAKNRRSAILVLQTMSRFFLARYQAAILKREQLETMSALTLQCWWRSQQTRALASNLRSAAVLIQKCMRKALARQQFFVLKQYQQKFVSALVLQCWWRSVKAHTLIDNRRLALLMMQKFSRMVLARKHLVILQQHRLESESSLTLQCWWRCQQARTLAGSRRSAIVMIQKFARMILAFHQLTILKQDRQESESTVILQCWWQGVKARTLAENRRSAVAIVQKFARMIVARNKQLANVQKFQQESASALALQCWWRHLQAQMLACSRRSAVATLQRFARMVLAVQQVAILQQDQQEFKSVLVLQCWWRCNQALTLADNRRSAVVAMQKFARMVLAHQQLAILQQDQQESESALTIQCWWRREQAGEVAKRLQAEAELQQLFRTKQHRKAVLIQKTWRKMQQRKTAASKGTLSSRVGLCTTKKRKPFGEINGENQMFSPLKTRRGTKVARVEKLGSGVENTNISNVMPIAPSNKVSVLPPIEKMKVAELREELEGLGVEKKELRKLRKAELVQMLTERRSG